jgi:hypothetical protein
MINAGLIVGQASRRCQLAVQPGLHTNNLTEPNSPQGFSFSWRVSLRLSRQTPLLGQKQALNLKACELPHCYRVLLIF